ncbi:MAG: adenylosuccinate lyase [bacterium]
MIARYATREMTALWSDERRLDAWLEVELAALDAMGEAGVVPADAPAKVRARARVNAARMAELEASLGHDLAAFVDSVAESVGPEGRWLHFGLTSSDVLDTALGVLLSETGRLLRAELASLRDAARQLALRHRNTPMAGRTHGMHAEPITFGLKVLLFWDELGRADERLARAFDDARVGKLSGAVGTFAHLAPRIEAAACERLGLRPAPVSSQIVPRDRHAAVVTAIALAGASLDRFATEIRHLQRTEVGEVSEGFGRAQKGSSAMPHKKNPVRSERVSGLARVLRGHAAASMENVPLWHERDISHSSAERIILPESAGLLHFMLRETRDIVTNLDVYPEVMRANLDRSRGLLQSQALLLALVRAGMERDPAYRAVQRLASSVRAGSGTLAEAAKSDAEVRERLAAHDLDELLSEARALANIGAVFERSGILAEGAR